MEFSLYFYDNYFAFTAGLVAAIAILSENNAVLKNAFLHPSPARLNKDQEDELELIVELDNDVTSLAKEYSNSNDLHKKAQNDITSVINTARQAKGKLRRIVILVIKPVNFFTRIVPSDSSYLFRYSCLLATIYSIFVLISCGYASGQFLFKSNGTVLIPSLNPLYVLGAIIQGIMVLILLIEFFGRGKDFLSRAFRKNHQSKDEEKEEVVEKEKEKDPKPMRILLLQFILNLLTLFVFLALLRILKNNGAIADFLNSTTRVERLQLYIIFSTPLLPLVIYFIKNNTIPSTILLFATGLMWITERWRKNAKHLCVALKALKADKPNPDNLGLITPDQKNS
ncbi:MAG: hypothetical protein KAR19_07485 [Bacteroidales bacterium]|nr:hypothetical protein [Bacteroidales bacterium]